MLPSVTWAASARSRWDTELVLLDQGPVGIAPRRERQSGISERLVRAQGWSLWGLRAPARWGHQPPGPGPYTALLSSASVHPSHFLSAGRLLREGGPTRLLSPAPVRSGRCCHGWFPVLFFSQRWECSEKNG